LKSYVKRYGASLKSYSDLPDFVHEIKPPPGFELASDQQRDELTSGSKSSISPHELVGDVHALVLVDLEKEGLAEYANQVKRLNIHTSSPIEGATPPPTINSSMSVTRALKSREQRSLSSRPAIERRTLSSQDRINEEEETTVIRRNNRLSSDLYLNMSDTTMTTSSASHTPVTVINRSIQVDAQTPPLDGGGRNERSSRSVETGKSGNGCEQSPLDVISDIFEQVDAENSGRLSVSEAKKLLVRLNERLGKRDYGEEDVCQFLQYLKLKNDNTISLRDFKAAYERLM
jgi:hypothetical protein